MAKKKTPQAWKIVAIVFIALFALVVIGGLWRASHYRTDFRPATEAQVLAAKNVVLNDLKTRGIDTAAYEFKFSNKVGEMGRDSFRKNVTEVFAFNSTVRLSYIIDTGSGKILVYSMTEFHDGFDHSKDLEFMGRRR
jgi:transposase InsO family protein